jgi:hypothetical protein
VLRTVRPTVAAMGVLLVGLAGATGAMTRYGVHLLFGVRPFPWSTLVINLLGSSLVGAVLAVAAARNWSPEVTAPVTVGFLGESFRCVCVQSRTPAGGSPGGADPDRPSCGVRDPRYR